MRFHCANGLGCNCAFAHLRGNIVPEPISLGMVVPGFRKVKNH